MIHQSIQSFQLESEKTGILLNASVQDGYIVGEEDGIKQVLNNLLQNAFIYNTGKEIKVNGKCEQSVYWITVSNQGELIPEDVRELVFERFYRVDSSRHREQHLYGTGLGLSIVKEIVEGFDGQVGLDSDGEMHHFWVKFPVNKHP